MQPARCCAMLSAACAVSVVMRWLGKWRLVVGPGADGEEGPGWSRGWLSELRRRWRWGRDELRTGMETLMWMVPLEVVEPVISMLGRGDEGREAEDEEGS